MTAIALRASDVTNATGSGADTYDLFDEAFRVSQYVFGVPLSLTIVAGNMLLLCVLARDANLRKVITNVHNLAACDLLAGATLGVNIATLHLHRVWRDDLPWLCLLWASLQMLPIYASFFHVMFITADRFIAVAFSSKYSDTQLLRGIRIGYSVIWVYLCIIVVLALPFSADQWSPHSDFCQPGIRLPAGYFILVVAGNILPCAVVSVALFVRMRYILRVHQCQIQVTNTITYDNLLKDTHAAKVCFMAFVLTTFAWTPFVVCQLLRVGGVRQEALHVASNVSFLFGQIGYLKFVVYFTKNADVGAGLKKLFR